MPLQARRWRFKMPHAGRVSAARFDNTETLRIDDTMPAAGCAPAARARGGSAIAAGITSMPPEKRASKAKNDLSNRFSIYCSLTHSKLQARPEHDASSTQFHRFNDAPIRCSGLLLSSSFNAHTAAEENIAFIMMMMSITHGRSGN